MEHIEIKGLKKVYNANRASQVTALNGVSFSLPEKGMIFIIGKSGCGKSTLLNILGGIDKPTEGSVYFDGKEINFRDEAFLDAYRNESVGFIFQDHNLLDNFTIADNIKMSMTVQNATVEDGKVDEVLSLVGLGDCKKKKPNQVSGGQRQRIAIARALIKNPKIMLADEPTGSLDSENGKLIFDLLKKLSADNLIIVVTHDLDAAYTYGDRIIEIKDGKITDDILKVKKFDLSAIKENYAREIRKSFVPSVADGKFTPSDKKAPRPPAKAGLSVKNALKIMFTWLKKGVVSVIISIVILSIVLAGLAVTRSLCNFDFDTVFARTYVDTDTGAGGLVKGSIDFEEYSVDLKGDAFTDEEYKALNQELGNVYKCITFSIGFSRFESYSSKVFNPNVSFLCELGKEVTAANLDCFFHSKLMLGAYPQKNDSYVEILISDYTADSLLYGGVKFREGTVMPNTDYNALVGKTFTSGYVNYKIAGIFSSYFSGLYRGDYDAFRRNIEYTFAKSYVYPVAITVNDAVKDYANSSAAIALNMTLKVASSSYWDAYPVVLYGISDSDLKTYKGMLERANLAKYNEEFTEDKLKDDEIIISYSRYLELFDRYKYGDDGKPDDDFADVDAFDLENLVIERQISDEETETLKVVGIFDDITISKSDPPPFLKSIMPDGVDYANLVVSKSSYKDDLVSANLNSYMLYTTFTGTVEDVKNRVDRAYEKGLIVNAPFTARTVYFKGMFDVIEDIINGVLVILFVFISLLMYSIISKNIREKSKEIGILRSLGANRGDVLKIFIFSDLVYAVFSIAVAAILYIVSCNAVNYSLCFSFGATLTLCAVEPLSILLMAGVAIVVIALSSVAPIIKYTRMAPVSVIRE